MKRRLLAGAGVALAVAAVLAVALWYFVSRPLYRPGVLRAGPAITRPLQDHDESFWKMEAGVKLYHFGDGAGDRVLVLHGGPGFPFRTPLPGLRPLAGRYRFIYYDQRGCGRSTRPIDRFDSGNYYRNVRELDARLGLGTHIADLERVRKILGERRLTLVAHSFGALLAALYAAEFPENVRGMLLVAPANLLKMPPGDGGLYQQVRARLPEFLRRDYQRYLDSTFDFSGIFRHTEAELRARNAEFIKYYAAAAGGHIPVVDGAEDNGGWITPALYLSMGRRYDWRPAMKQVEAPVLVVHGAEDLQPESASRAFAACFPNARVRVIEGAGHFVFHDRPEEFAAVAGEFLDNL